MLLNFNDNKALSPHGAVYSQSTPLPVALLAQTALRTRAGLTMFSNLVLRSVYLRVGLLGR